MKLDLETNKLVPLFLNSGLKIKMENIHLFVKQKQKWNVSTTFMHIIIYAPTILSPISTEYLTN